MAEELLDKETIGLTDILRVLGDRHYALKENVREYWEDMQERKVQETADAAQAAANTPSDAASEA